ncbi:AAA family ATPase [Sphingomonas sp. 1185]|uniref:AAA family ATPase n=1 Tax=Sphingomonas sp. 1185 TaxID=3156411 RepID=UPI00339AA52A
MQFVDRTKVPPPGVFQGKPAAAERAALLAYLGQDAARQAQSPPPPRQFEPDSEMLAALDSLFRSKCAFCESRAPINVRLFRPPEQASPLAATEFAHLYYVWLRTDWNNHYAICEGCARGSERQFPVRDGRRGKLPTRDEFTAFVTENYGVWRQAHRDKPLLIDPCRVRAYDAHFSVDLGGLVQPRSRAGGATIEVFNLNRDELVNARFQAFDQYFHLLFSEFDKQIASSVLDFAQLEFGGVWYLLLRRLLADALRRLGRSAQTSRRQIGNQLQRIWRTDIGRKALEDAMEAIRSPERLKIAARAATRPGPTHRLTGILLRDFKSLERMDIVVPEPVAGDPSAGLAPEAAALLILGENAAGKSSLLEGVALALCGERVRGNIGKAANTFILDPDLMGAIGTSGPGSGLVTLQFEDGAETTLHLGVEFAEDNRAGNLPPVFAYGAFRHYSASSKRAPRLGHVGTLFQSQIVLPNPESWLLSLNSARFAMVVRALRDILSIDGDFDVLEADRANERCVLITRVSEDPLSEPIRTPLQVASSGYRSVLAMICDMLEGFMGRSDRNLRPLDEARAIILIDEIEAHLHPRWKMQIMAALRRAFPQSVIIATSHDPLCVRGMHNGEVSVFNRVRNTGTTHKMPYAIEERIDLPDIEAMTIEQLLTSDLFEMFTTDSPTIERKLAELAGLLARSEAGDAMSAEEADAVAELQQQVNESLPLGSSQAQRLVLSAVSEFLIQRRTATAAQLRGLEADARQSILDALESL